MRLSLSEIRANAMKFAAEWANVASERAEAQSVACMKSLSARHLALASVLSLGASSAQALSDEPPVSVTLDSRSAALRLSSAAATESAVADRTTLVALTTPASLSLSAATLSLTLQPESKDAAAPAASADATLTASDAKPVGGEDKSGTDPTKFLRTLGLRNEYQRLTNDKSFNLTTLTYIEPFADGRMNLRLKAPLAYTDAAGDDEFGLGDISLRYNWLPIVDAKKGVLLGAELIADSATEDVLGRGKWTIGPSLTYAMFLSPSVIFAPAYQHNISFAGDDNRKDVNESVIDLYMVFTATDKKSWLIVDPTLVIDWETEQNTPFTLELEYGRNIGTLLGGALNAYIRPGIGIGQDRPYDWNIEVGFTVVGF